MSNEKDTNTEITAINQTTDFEPAAWALWIDELGKNKNIALRNWRTSPETRKWVLAKTATGGAAVGFLVERLLEVLPF